MKKICFTFLGLIPLVIFPNQILALQTVSAEPHVKQIISDWAENYQQKIESATIDIFNFHVTDTDDYLSVWVSKDSVSVSSGRNERAPYLFFAKKEVYQNIYNGELTAITAAGKANENDPVPFDFEVDGDKLEQLPNSSSILFIINRFFNKHPHDKVLLGYEHSRKVHGGNAIPLFYESTPQMGLRSAWYQVRSGEHLNEPGDTNPFPQAFIIIDGNGYAKLGSDTLRIRKNEVYYVAPGNDHVLWTDEQITLIWLAWGEGA